MSVGGEKKISLVSNAYLIFIFFKEEPIQGGLVIRANKKRSGKILATITFGFPIAGANGILALVIPARFPLT